jgi:chorismate dehydratase
MSGVGARLGIVAYTNVAPLHWGLRPWPGATFHRGVPTDLNARLLAGDLDLTLVSSVEFIRHRDRLAALPDFSIAARGRVGSVTLFHPRPWSDLAGARIAVTRESATSVALLSHLLASDALAATLTPHPTDLDAMLGAYDAALLIGDAALVEGQRRRSVHGAVPQTTDLGEVWFARTGLPFTFAVWAYDRTRPPSARLIDELRAARERGLAHLQDVAEAEALRLGLPSEVLEAYLRNFRYFLEPSDRAGLAAFAARFDPTCRPDDLVIAAP